MQKIRVGWFSFSCCEDSTIVFTEMLNEHYKDWFKIMHFASARILQKKEDITNLDIAFVEGAIASEKDALKLKKIRENSKKLVAIGSCAVTGMPSAQRNEFDEERKKEIQFLVDRFRLAPSVVPLEKIVVVDYKVTGCPMAEDAFLKVLEQVMKDLGVGNAGT